MIKLMLFFLVATIFYIVVVADDGLVGAEGEIALQDARKHWFKEPLADEHRALKRSPQSRSRSKVSAHGHTGQEACVQVKKLKFKTCDGGLPWPLEDFTDITVLITHGIHCIDIIYKNDSDEYHRFHQEHCMNLMRQLSEFFEASPNYTVPYELCRNFRDVAFPGGRVRRGNWSGWRRGRRSVTYYPTTTQTLNFKMLATRNFEQLLLKEKQEPEKISNLERNYLEGSRNSQSVHIAALGIYCKYEGYVGVVKDTIEYGPQS